MAKNESGSKTILIIVAIILGILFIGGVVVGISFYYLYKVGSGVDKTTAPTKTNQVTTTENWREYPNSRYSFSIKYPSTFTAQFSQNGDGATLTSTSPAITISAYGSLNSSSQNLDEYLNVGRADLFKGSDGAQEIAANEANLGNTPAQERRWQYTNSIDGSQTVMDQVTALKNGNFYTAQMVINYSDYSQYAPMFDTFLEHFVIK